MSDEQPKAAGTYFAQAQADAAMEAKGRFAAQRPTVNGTAPVVTPPAMPAPAWGPWPNDPDPLGEDINSLPDMTTVSGVPR